MISAQYNAVRMGLAQKMFEDNFAKWATIDQTQALITQLIGQIKSGQIKASSIQDSLFTIKQPSAQPIQQRTPLTPPKSPSMDKSMKLVPSPPIHTAPVSDKLTRKEPLQGPSIPKFYFPDGNSMDSESINKMMVCI